MTLSKSILIAVILFIYFNCSPALKSNPSLIGITFINETDFVGSPVYQLKFEKFSIEKFPISEMQKNRIIFEYPPQNILFGSVYFEPQVENGITTFSFMDTGLVGLDSLHLRELFMKNIIENKINIYFGDSLVQQIFIEKEPVFEYFVGTAKELEQRIK